MPYISPNNEYPRFAGDVQLDDAKWIVGQPLPEGWIEVVESEMPAVGENEIAYEEFPIEDNGAMIQNWVVRNMTAEEIELRDAPKKAKEKLVELGLTEFEVQALVKGLVR